MRAAICTDDALQLLEDQLLHNCAKRVNDDVWLELSFDLIKVGRVSNSDEVTHKNILSELCTPLSELDDIRTGLGHSSVVIARTIVAIRGVEAFGLVYSSPSR